MSRPLSLRLREDTRDSHTAAERMPFVTRLFRGAVDREEWAAFLVNLRALYRALEDELQRHREDPAVSCVFFPELFRLEALERDLAHYLGATRASHATPTPAAQRYAAYVHAIASEAPALLVPHAYTRYLGDLSGGQAMKKSIERAFGLDATSSDGVAFFTFDQVADHQAMKTRYRAGLDAVGAASDEARCDRLVAEARVAFERNGELMADLESGARAAAGI